MKNSISILSLSFFLFLGCENSPHTAWLTRSKKTTKATSTAPAQEYAPSITVSPESGVFNPLPSSLSLRFPEDLNLSLWTGEEISVKGTGSCPVLPLLATHLSGHEMTLTLNLTGCDHDNEIIVSLNQGLLYSKTGIAAAGMKSFVYKLDKLIAPAPTMNRQSKRYSALPTSVDYTFDSSIDMDSLTADAFTLTGSGNCPTPLIMSLSKSGSVASVSFDPSLCQHGDKVEISLDNTKFSDLTAHAGMGSLVLSLELDTVGPQIADSTVTTTLGNKNPIPSAIKLRLPNDLDPATVDLSDFSLTKNSDCSSATFTGFSHQDNLWTINVDSSSCQNGGEIRIDLNLGGTKDLAGNAGTGIISMEARLVSELPATPVWSLTPGTIATLPATLDLEFSSTTDTSTVLAALTVTASSPCPNQIITASTWSGTTLQLSIDASTCAHNSTVTFSLDMSMVKNLIGETGSGLMMSTFTFDKLGPANPGFTPGEGDFLSIPSNLSLLFPADTDMSTVTVSSVQVSGSDGCPVSPLQSFTKDQTTLSVVVDSACTDGGKIQFQVDMSSIKDIHGNIGSGGFSKTFVTNSAIPSIPGVSVSTGTFSTLPNSLTLTFQNDIDMSTVELSDFSLTGTGSCPVSPLQNLSISGQVVTLTLSTTGCAHGNGLYLSLNMAGVKNTLGTSGSGQFTQSYLLDTQGPAAATLSPLSASFSTLPTNFTFTFSSDTNMSSVSSSDFSISTLSGCGSLSLQSFSKSGQTASLTLNTASCGNSDSLKVVLDMSQVTDAYGNPGTGNVSGIYTLDTQGPALASLNLSSGIRASLPEHVTFTFSADTDMASVASSDFVTTGTGGCSTNPLLTLTKSGQIATLSLNTANCTHGSTISVSLAMGQVTDALGNPGTGSIGATYTLDSQGPAAATLNVPSATLRILPSSVQFTFAADTDMSSVTSSDFIGVSNGSCSSPTIQSFTKSGYVVTLGLAAGACAHSNSIQVSLDMTAVTDAVGNAGTGTVTATYTLDVQGPSAPTVSHTSGTFTTLPTSITYTFSSDTNMASLSLLDFTTSKSGLCLANPVTDFQKSGQTATLTINTLGCILSSSITVNLNMAGVEDLLGNPGIGTFSQTYVKGN